MARLRWARSALRDLHEICEHLGSRSRRQAAGFARKAASLAVSILQQPLLGSMVPEYEDDSVRERSSGNYRFIYRVQGADVVLLWVRHGARLLPPNPPQN